MQAKRSSHEFGVLPIRNSFVSCILSRRSATRGKTLSSEGRQFLCLEQLSCQVCHPQAVEFAGIEIQARLMLQVALVAALQGWAENQSGEGESTLGRKFIKLGVGRRRQPGDSLVVQGITRG